MRSQFCTIWVCSFVDCKLELIYFNSSLIWIELVCVRGLNFSLLAQQIKRASLALIGRKKRRVSVEFAANCTEASFGNPRTQSCSASANSAQSRSSLFCSSAASFDSIRWSAKQRVFAKVRFASNKASHAPSRTLSSLQLQAKRESFRRRLCCAKGSYFAANKRAKTALFRSIFGRFLFFVVRCSLFVFDVLLNCVLFLQFVEFVSIATAKQFASKTIFDRQANNKEATFKNRRTANKARFAFVLPMKLACDVISSCDAKQSDLRNAECCRNAQLFFASVSRLARSLRRVSILFLFVSF